MPSPCLTPGCENEVARSSTLCPLCIVSALRLSRCPQCGNEGSVSSHAGPRGALTLVLNLPCVECALPSKAADWQHQTDTMPRIQFVACPDCGREVLEGEPCQRCRENEEYAMRPGIAPERRHTW